MPRKKPFSGKQKKFQLQAKRQEKHFHGGRDGSFSLKRFSREEDSSDESSSHSKQFTTQKSSSKTRDRYKLQLQEENRDERVRTKELSMQPYVRRSVEDLEAGSQLFYDPPIMFPVRPSWDQSLSLERLEVQEQRYFKSYCEDFKRDCSLGYVELNLETWRQLWRVLEMSDILLHIIDVRYAALHFNPVLYEYITRELNKKMIVILNKCDIVPPSVAISWKDYLKNEFPQLDVVIFTSFPKDDITRDSLAKGKQSRRRRKKAAAVGPLELWNVCHQIVKPELNILSWKDKMIEDMRTYVDDSGDSDQSDCEVEEVKPLSKVDLSYAKHSRYTDGVLTIGCVGYPNVGKSSVINGLMGRKVVSISRTPGHTKHFQTIFLTGNVKLCDCPGLVFPATAPRAIQVLAGMYPVAQIREPYSVVQYLAERCDLPKFLGIKLPEDERAWSAYLICDELAELKGFKTARGARNDSYRAANWILRAALEGKILFYHLPPGYNTKSEFWAHHHDTEALRDIQLEKLASAEGQRSAMVRELSSDTETSESSDDELSASRNTFALLSEDC